MNKDFYTVTELNTYIKNLLQKDTALMSIKLTGELRDVKKSINGHYYFTVIDEESSISGILFSFNMHNLSGYTPKDGDKVEIAGSINVYVKGGRYSISVIKMNLAGEGAKLLALKKLTEKLQKEGLFSRPKRPINLYPNAIGIITGKNSAAYQDLVTNIHRRYPLVTVYVFYSSVQGSEAAKELVAALKKSYTYKLDTLIISRGGGSNEDLDVFNDEEVVRTAFASPIPLIAAIGHEIDFTLVEYVADRRASTPTAAAEYSTIDKREIYELLDNQYQTMEVTISNRIKMIKEKLSNLKNRPFFINPSSIYADQVKDLTNKKDNLIHAMKLYLANKTNDLSVLNEKLKALNPKRVLNRGFALLKGKNGKIIKNVSDVELGQEIETTVADGNIYASVTRKEKQA